MSFQIWFDIAVVAAFGIAALLLRKYLPAYLTEKGKNLATKEDIEEITRTVESVKTAHERGTHVHRVHFETEFAALDDIWRKVALYRTSFGVLFTDLAQTAVERKASLQKFRAAFADLEDTADAKSPFYPEDIHASVMEILISGIDQLSDAANSEMPRTDYLAATDTRHSYMVNECDKLSAQIRARIASLVVYKA
jgi:hypothetical protein